MEDRTKILNGKSSKLMCPSDYTPDFTTFMNDLRSGSVYVDVNANNDLNTNPGVYYVGTPLNKANLLSDTTAARYGEPTTANIDDVFNDIVDIFDSKEVVRYGTIDSTGWSASAPYTQTVAVQGITSSMNPMWDLYIPDGTATATAIDMIDACSLVNKLTTGTNAITLTCYQAKPSATFQVMLKG